MTDFRLDELCAVACAETWRGDGEILASPIGIIPGIGARLAKATFAPDLLLSDGVSRLIAGIEPLGGGGGHSSVVEGWVPFRAIFDIVWSGRRHVMMGATQIDQFGNQNIACIGDWSRPRAQLIGARGAPGNTVNHPTSYWIPQHSPRAFVPRVDFVSGVGYDRAARLGASGHWHEIRRVVSNLGVFDFDTPDHSMRLASVHPGVAVEDVARNTGFALVVPARVAVTRAPSAEELRLLRTVIDPNGLGRRELLLMRAEGGAGTALAGQPRSVLHTRICDLFGVRYPIVQTGMGWVAGARLAAATSAAGGLGVIASATMTFEQLEGAIREVKERTDKPFGVNLRSDQAGVNERVDLMVREGVKVASFAQAPGRELIKKLKGAGIVTCPTIGARRHAEKVAEWGVDAVIAQGQEGGGHTGAIPTSLLLPQVVSAVDVPVIGAGGFFDGRGLVAALAWGASGIAMGTRFLLTRESTVPEAVKETYLDTEVTGTVVTRSIDGYPQRVIRTRLVDRLEGVGRLRSLLRAMGYAWAFRKLTGSSFAALLKEGLALKKKGELTFSQLAMAANAPMMTKAALVDGRTDAGVLPTGQNVGLIEDLPAVAELIQRVMDEANATLARLGA